VKERILVLCTGNSARSQMAEGLLRQALGSRFEIHSAGSRPSRVREEAVTVMRELGIDISWHRSKHLDEFLGTEFRYVITVCDHAAGTCPVFPGIAERIHWSFEDPAAVDGDEETRLAAFRRIRDQIAARVQAFSSQLGA
jgi:arsenate reductase